MTYPSAKFNASGHAHADRYVKPRHDSTPLRYPDGTPTGFELAREQLRFTDEAKRKGARDGLIRLDHHEVLSIPGDELVFHRGGAGYLDGGNVKYGHVAVSDLKGHIHRPQPPGKGRGAPAPLSPDPEHENGYLVRVHQVPPEMLYKRLEDPPVGKPKRGAKWMHYGDPAAGQGDRTDIHYTVLCWSWLDVRGGGMVRCLLPDGAVVHPCDVEPIRHGSWDNESRDNGETVGIYVCTEQAGNQLYGWMLQSHRWGDSSHSHLVLAT